MGCCCDKCGKMAAWLLLIVGVLFLLQDQGKFAFWGLSWYTVVFLFLGLKGVATENCKACQVVRKRK